MMHEDIKYRPPSPTMATYINLISGIFAGHFTTETFREGVRRCFISVGLAPYNADGDYLQYVSHANAYAKAKAFRGKVGIARKTEISAIDLLADDIHYGLDENDGQSADEGEDMEFADDMGDDAAADTAAAELGF